jgi:hypothetical protein
MVEKRPEMNLQAKLRKSADRPCSLLRGSAIAIQGVQIVETVRVPDLLTSNCDCRQRRSLI